MPVDGLWAASKEGKAMYRGQKSEMNVRSSPWRLAGFCLLIAAGCLLICSKSSPLYPLNDWSDANIYFTMGKGMAHGRVIYRDLYDHKGPLLYALYALCYLISPRSFLGVWFLEIACLAGFLAVIFSHLRLYGARWTAWAALPLLAALVTSSLSFQQGGSAEELCIPLLCMAFLTLMRFLQKPGNEKLNIRRLVGVGVLCGCVLWIKFTMLGMFLAWIAVVFGRHASRRQWKAALQSLLWYGLGMMIASLPWLIYFSLNRAVGDWLQTYLCHNLFLYSGEAVNLLNRVKAIAGSGWSWFTGNLPYTLPLLLGLGFCTFRRRVDPWEKVVPGLCVGLTALGVFAGGKSYVYYGLILAAFGVLGMAPFCLFVEGLIMNPRRIRVLSGVVVAASIGLCAGLSPNVGTSFLKPKESLMQYQLAEVMNEGPEVTLLNYGFMDAGFFTATGIVPHVKYFHQTNVPLQEMLDEQIRYVEEGLCTYVVTRGKQPVDMNQNYELIATADSPEGFWYDHVYLYRLRQAKALALLPDLNPVR